MIETKDSKSDSSPQERPQFIPFETFKKHPLKIALLAIILMAISCILLALFLMQSYGAYSITSAGMEPTLMGPHTSKSSSGMVDDDGGRDNILADKRLYRTHEPKFGDIIVFRAPKEADLEHAVSGVQVDNILVKRIVGLPGDTIELNKGQFLRNGQALQETYLKEPMDATLEWQFKFGVSQNHDPFHLKAGQYWVMGDNRNNSADSRYWGPLERNRIIGKIVSILKPSSRARSFP